MLEIKFRLRDANNKVVGYEKWYKGHVSNDGICRASPDWLYSEDGEYWNPTPIFHCFKDTYTGFKDKHGKEIYDGDFVKDGIGLPHKVYFDCGMFLLEPGTDDIATLWGLNPSDCAEIIGNIHENPELKEENNA